MPSLLTEDSQQFISSSAEASPTWNMQEIAYQMQCLGIRDVEHNVCSRPFGASSDSGASSGDNSLDHAVSHSFQPTAPGPWFYEVPDVTRADLNAGSPPPFSILSRGSKNVTENVIVPSSEHVAEIVGRQGCKIKALRAKTNTYIKTPVRGEDAVFVVTGRAEDVVNAKKEIECAADHFTQIRASRRHSQGVRAEPGHITAYVRVPYRVVGLVVGPKGATIKRIQQDTHTYIITPSREREPVFEITGLPANVEVARREIENHIFQRTGNMPITDSASNAIGYGNADVQGNSQIYHNSAAHSTPRRGSADDVNDFHQNGNDVSFTGAVFQMNSSTISKPHSVGHSPPPVHNQLSYSAAVGGVQNSANYPIWSGMQNDMEYNRSMFHQQMTTDQQYVTSTNSFMASGSGLTFNNDLSDEGFGGSPTRPQNSWTSNGLQETQQHGLPTHLISSIWSVLDNSTEATNAAE